MDEINNNLYCIYCNKLYNNKKSLASHKPRCKQNPNRIKCGNPNNLINNYTNKLKSGEITIWNKGLNKNNNESIKRCSNTLKTRFQQKQYKNFGLGIAKTPERELERKRKISATLKANPKAGGLRPNSGRSKKGWYKGFYCRSTYELVYVIYNIDHNINFSACKRIYTYEWNNTVYKYYPDFELEDGTIIEIKGYSNAQTEAKINAVKDRPIQVLYLKDLIYAFNYVNTTYKFNKLTDLYE